MADGDANRLDGPARVLFGNAAFDHATLSLTVNGREVPLEPRPLSLLVLLLGRRGEVVRKGELLDTLWTGRTVTEASLTKCVARLRTALGDDGHAVIRTVHGFGYRLDPAIPAKALSAIESNAPIIPPPCDLPAPPAYMHRPWAVTAGALVLVGLVAGVWQSVWPWTKAPVPPPPEARTLYMRGLQDWAQRSPASLSHGIEEFTASLAIDAGYAAAEAGLANCYNLLPEYGAMPAAQAYSLAKAHAVRAVTLAPDLAAAHAAYGFALFWGDWDFARGLTEYRRAMRLAPADSGIHHWLATAFDNTGNHTQALVEIERALELEPASLPIRSDRALILFNAGRVTEARAALTDLEAGNPDAVSIHAYLAHVALATGDDAGYLREAGIHVRLQRDETGMAIIAAAQAGYAAQGRDGMRRGLLSARLSAYAAGTGSAFDVSRSYAQIGNVDRAVTYLDLAIDRHDAWVICILNAPEWRPYLGNPALIRILSRLHLDQAALEPTTKRSG